MLLYSMCYILINIFLGKLKYVYDKNVNLILFVGVFINNMFFFVKKKIVFIGNLFYFLWVLII